VAFAACWEASASIKHGPEGVKNAVLSGFLDPTDASVAAEMHEIL